MANILLTGGRAPAALELARIFNHAGHTVYMAESLPYHLSAPSSALASSFRIPPPRQQPAAFVTALKDLIYRHQIDLLVPTCEEAFHIAGALDELAPLCRVFVEPLDRLDLLHHKYKFIQLARNYGLPVPDTILLDSVEDLENAFQIWPERVLKPVYSRFASRTLILPRPEQARACLAESPPGSWVAQAYVPGSQICTYSVAHRGHLTAHAAYRSDFTAGQGATILFQHIDHPAALDWVRRFVANFGYTGQIAFDFIETPQGELFALECNPRATSGVHLYSGDSQFVNAFLDQNQPCQFPNGNDTSMLLTAMLLYGLPMSIRKRELKKWLLSFSHSHDVVFRWEDPLPALLQLRSIFHYVALGWRHGISPLQASTLDIEWNGEINP